VGRNKKKKEEGEGGECKIVSGSNREITDHQTELPPTKLVSISRRISQARPVFLPEMEKAVIDALRNDRFLDGENVSKFEEEFAAMVGTDYAISTNSGTSAIAFVLIAIGANRRKCITTPWSFIATANAVIHAGGEPVFADISLEDFCQSPKDTEIQLKKCSEGKKGVFAILPVHIYGQPFDFDRFDELSRKFDVPIVEDAAQAHGARYKGRRVGSLGVAAAFSFYPSKNMSVLGDGGMVTTNEEKIARYVSKLRNSGRISRYEHDILGYTARLNTVNAAIGRVQLRYLEEWNAKRRQIAERYSIGLKTIEQILLPPRPTKEIEPVYHQFVIRIRNLRNGRERLKQFLEKNEIEVGVHYPIPIHLQPLYVKMYGYKRGDFRNSEILSQECLSLPMHPFLSNEEVDYVIEKIREFFERRN
jgi:perosamine synthetase